MPADPFRPFAAPDDPETEPQPGPAQPDKEGEKAEPFRASLADKLIKARTLQVSGEINDATAARVIAELLVLEADDPKAPITMLLNSPGGAITAGFAIYDVMRFISAPVRVVCTGLTASIAVVILLGATKANRLSLPNTRLLIHQPLIRGTAYGPASDLEITANEILKTRAKINQLLATETGQPLEKVETDTHRDYWLTATEAVAYGLIARVVQNRAELA